LYFHELKRTGAHIHLPCVNRSEYLTNVSGKNVFMGFVHVQGLEEQLVQRLLKNRSQLGNFLNLPDFIERIFPGIEQLNILIRVGAFQFSGKSKKELLWEANFLHKKNTSPSGSGFLFREQAQTFHMPELVQHPMDDALDEIELLGFSLCNVFELVKENAQDFLPASELPYHLGKDVSVLGWLVTSKSVNTVSNQTMHFHTFLDSCGNWLDTIFFPGISRYYPVTGKGCYAMKGKVVEEFGVYSIEATECRKIGLRDRESFPDNINRQHFTPSLKRATEELPGLGNPWSNPRI
jgi:DNA polymerase-3 subunit alpha